MSLDELKISEIRAASIIVRSRIEGVDYAVNPYVGCAHACVYCYASFMTRFSGNSGAEWGSFVKMKVNAPDLVPRDLRRVHPGSEILLSSVTDPYQPVETSAGLTRRCLLALSARPDLSISILTKSDLVLRDLPVFKTIRNVEVGFTVTTPRDEISAVFERRAPPSSRRIHAMKMLADAGIRCWAFVGPVLPAFSDDVETISNLFLLLKRAGATYVLVDAFNFYPSCTGRYLATVRRYFPDKYRSCFNASRDPADYRETVRLAAMEGAREVNLDVRLAF